MISSLRRFQRCQRGNIAILTVLLAAPLLILCVGVIDTNRAVSLSLAMQKSADAAVMTAFRSGRLTHQQRASFAKAHFFSNINGSNRRLEIKTKLVRRIYKDKVVFTFRARTRVDSLLGKSETFTTKNIAVEASAELRRSYGSRPRLIRRQKGKIAGPPSV